MNHETSKNTSIEILIVEDSITQAEQIKYILEKAGYHVSVAYNGKEAVSIISKHKPSIVISDIVMPEMDGYELCNHIKSDSNLMDIPVILLTSLSDPSDVIKGLEARADHFVTKPYDENYLLARIQYILSNWELRKEQELKMGMNILIRGQKYFITSERMQILHLLISTYEAAVLQNQELIKTRDELKRLNEQLEEMVEKRTAALKAEIAERTRAEEALRKNEKELRKRVKELEEFYNMAVNRELRMVELKKELERAEKELGRYKNHEI